MPSLNYYTRLRSGRRVRVNVCEGHVSITEEYTQGGGKWHQVQPSIKLTNDEAKLLANEMLKGVNAETV